MLEMNIRIVHPGMSLYVWARKATVKGTNLTHSILQRVCGTLRHRHGLAAVPYPGEEATLLVATQAPIKALQLTGSDWIVEVVDAGYPAEKLTLVNDRGREIIPQLIERGLQAELARDDRYWTLDSPALWYEAQPFRQEEGIAAYRRYEVRTLFIEGEGVGVIVDAGTAFFATESLAYYFESGLPADEEQRRRQQFQRLTDRQKGQRGTLLYDNGQSRLKCYFGSAPEGITCKTTDTIRIKDATYASLAHYYREVFPNLIFNPDGRAVKVSFPHKGSAVWAAAELLRIRVLNENRPKGLRNADKIDPQQRYDLIKEFWQSLGDRPFRSVAPGVKSAFWKPGADRIHFFKMPSLCFRQGAKLAAPTESTPSTYRQHYQKRLDMLDEHGCYSVPPMTPRNLHLAFPALMNAEAIQLAQSLTEVLCRWTKLNNLKVEATAPYQHLNEAIELLANANAQMVVFVLNDEPLAYHEAAFGRPWRIKRMTQTTLRNHYRDLKEGARIPNSNKRDLQKGRRNWDSFVRMNALGIVQLLDAVPYRTEELGPYEAHIAIDVGYDGRHFAVSLEVARDSSKYPDFRIRTDFQIKHDPQHYEEINRRLLADQIVETVRAALGRRFDPLASGLMDRDGHFVGDEVDGIEEDVIEALKESGHLTQDAVIHYADLRKSSNKAIRMWEVKGDQAANVLEGHAVLLNQRTVVLTTTGAGTLRQGTAAPLVLVAHKKRCPNILDAARTCFLGSQLNWSSPKEAQRLPLVFKNADDELKARDAQEIRRLR